MSEVKISLKGHNVYFESINQDFKNFFISSFSSSRKGEYFIPLSEFLLQKNQATFKFFFKSSVREKDTPFDLKKNLKERPVPYKYSELEEISEGELFSKLEESDFNYQRLRDFQVRNLKKICSMPFSANFSVPGAGKTSEALPLRI